MIPKDIQELERLFEARMPVVAIESYEEAKVLDMMERFARLNERSLWRWSVTDGLRLVNGKESAYNTTRIEEAMRHIENSPANSIYVFLDAHKFMDDPMVLRRIRDIAAETESTHRMLVFLSPRLEVPEELARLLRKGRFDEIFFVDLPTAAAREAIVRIHLRRNKQDPGGLDVARIAAACDGFSGAEIEQAIVAALYEAHAEKKPLDTGLIEAEMKRTRPLSVVMAEKVATLRDWARSRAVPAE